MSTVVTATPSAIMVTPSPFVESLVTPSLVVQTIMNPSLYIEPTSRRYPVYTSGPAIVYPTPNTINVGAIVGGVVGGLALVTTVVGVLYWMRRRRHAKSRSMVAMPEAPEYYSPRSSVAMLEAPTPVYKPGGLDEKEVVVYKFDEMRVDEKRTDKWPADKKM